MPSDDFKVTIQAEIDEASLSAIQQRIKDLGKNSKTKVTFDDGGTASKTAKNIQNINTAAKSASSSSKTLGTALRQTFGISTSVMAVVTAIRTLTKVAREAVTEVKEIDSALTQLQIVTGASGSSLTSYLEESISLAKELGQEVTSVISSIETFARLGYDFGDSSTLAEYVSILSNIAAVDLSDATEGITAIIKGYSLDVSDAEHVADVLTQVGQSYAVSASELITAYEKAGAALSASGTSFEKSAALIASGNAAVQNAESVGTALKSVSARIRGATTELEEMGESTEDLADGFSKYASEIESLTGFSILEEGTTNEYKDIYDIFDGISQCWDDLSDTAQARVAEILGGTRQLSVISSILTNWSDATGAYEDAMNSAGTATEANEVYMESLEAKISQLHASLTELATDTIPTDFLKGAVDAGDSIVQLLDNTNLLQVALAGLATFGAGKGLSALATGFENVINRMSNFGNAMTLLEQSTAVGVADFSDLMIMTQGLSASQIEAVVSSAALTTEQKIAIITNSTLSKTEKEAAISAVELSAAEGTATTTTASLSASVKGLAASLGMTTTGFLALVAGIAAVTAALVAFNYSQHEYTRALEAAEEASQSYSDMKSDLESLEEEYASITSQVEELKALQTDGSITLEQEAELENLQAQSEELERQIELQTTLTELQQEAADLAVETAANMEQSYLESMQDQYGKVLGMIEALAGYIGGSEVDGVYKSDAQQWNSKDTSVNGLAQESIEQLREYQQEYEAIQEQIYNSENATQASVWENRKTEIAGYIEDETEQLTGYAETLQSWIDQYTDDAGNVTEGYEDSVAEWQATLNDIATIDMSDLEKQVYEIDSFLSSHDDEDNSISNALSSAVENGEDLQSVLDELGISLNDIGDDISIETLEKYFNAASESAETAITNVHELADSLDINLNDITNINPLDVSGLEVPDTIIESWSELQEGIDAYNYGLENISTQEDELISYVDEIIPKANELTEAYKEYRDGNFSNKSVEEMYKKFPELADYAGDFDEQIVHLLGDMRSDTISKFAKRFEELSADSGDAKKDLQSFMDAVLDLEDVVGSLQFSIDIETETDSLEALYTAIDESTSATGMSSDSVEALTSRYEDLADFNPSKLFELTSNGVHANRTELRKLEQEYKNNTIEDAKDDLIALKENYDSLTDEINACSDAEERSTLYAERDTILQQIEDTATLAAQYEGLTSKYNAYLEAQDTGKERDMYEAIIDGYDDIKDTLEHGWVDDTVRAYVDLLSYQDMSTSSAQELLDRWNSIGDTIEGTTYSLKDFWTEDEDGNSTSTGLQNLYNALEQLQDDYGEKWVWTDTEGLQHIEIDTDSLDDLAERLDMDKESLEQLIRTMAEAGMDVTIGSWFDQFMDLKDSIDSCIEAVEELSGCEVTFNVDSTDSEDIQTQIDNLVEIIDENLRNADGTINIDATGAAEATQLLEVLYQQLVTISGEAVVMNIDTSSLDEDAQEAVNILQGTLGAWADYEVSLTLNEDTTQAEQAYQEWVAELQEYLDNAELDPEIKTVFDDEQVQAAMDSVSNVDFEAGAHINEDDLNTITEAIESLDSDDLASIGIDTNSDEIIDDFNEVEEYEFGNKKLGLIVDYSQLVDAKNVWNGIQDRTVTMTIKETTDSGSSSSSKSSSKSSGSSSGNKTLYSTLWGFNNLSGTAHLDGTSYAGGKSGVLNPNLKLQDSWRTKYDDVALTGEEGTEIVSTKDGYWYTVGENGAEFAAIPAGSVIFDAQQTKTLLSTGKINARGRSLLSGTAYGGTATGSLISVSGSVKSGQLGSGSSSSSSSATEEAEEFSEVLDWIEIKIDRIERAISSLDLKASSTFKSWSTRMGALSAEMSSVTQEISLQQQAYNRYMAQANSVNLSSYYKSLVQNGTINIEDIEDEDLSNLISEYQEWFFIEPRKSFYCRKIPTTLSRYNGAGNGKCECGACLKHK